MTVRVRRPGLRALHPSKFVYRSESEKRTSRLRAAWIAPEMFQSGVMRAHLYPLRPAAEKGRWSGLLAVSFPVPLAERFGAPVERNFGATLFNGAKQVHRFSRRIRLSPDHPDVRSTPEITFLEPVVLPPGRYTLTAVLADPESVDPHAARVVVEVPEIPQRAVFLVGPMLGRPAGANLVVRGSGIEGEDRFVDEDGFQPLLVQQIDEPVDLVALTQTCIVGSEKYLRKRSAKPPSVSRTLRRDGVAVGRLAATTAEFEEGSGVRCSNLVDLLPAGSLEAGEYTFVATLADERDGTPHTVRFAVAQGASGARGSD